VHYDFQYCRDVYQDIIFYHPHVFNVIVFCYLWGPLCNVTFEIEWRVCLNNYITIKQAGRNVRHILSNYITIKQAGRNVRHILNNYIND
jgi:hypothetical protein